MPKKKITSSIVESTEPTNHKRKKASTGAKAGQIQIPVISEPKSNRLVRFTKVGFTLTVAVILMIIASVELYEAIKISDTVQKLPKPAIAISKVVPPTENLPLLGHLENCQKGTVLNVIAHEDDDLLFMNPDISNEIDNGKCIRTIYVTAGDDGQSVSYWQRREQGVKAAYAAMYHLPNSWQSTTAGIAGHEFSVATLDGVPSVALVFLHLPDGNTSGKGFISDQNETLKKLRTGSIAVIHTINTKTSYTSGQLINLLSVVMNLDNPDTINTNASAPELEVGNGDHSDHQAVGYFTDQARQNYRESYTFSMYLGYQSGHKPVNLSEADSANKLTLFNIYANYDAAICIDTTRCQGSRTYTTYMQRQYIYKNEAVIAK